MEQHVGLPSSSSTVSSRATSTGLHPNLLLLILAIAMLFVTYLSGIIPIFIKGIFVRSGKKYAKWHSMLSCFSGGVFLATTFLDIIPHVIQSYSELNAKGYFNVPFPLPEFVMCVGFFFVYFMEQVILTVCMKGAEQGHFHSHSHAPPPSSSRRTSLQAPPPRSLKTVVEEGEKEAERFESNSTIHEAVIEEAVKYVSSETDAAHSFIKTITFTFAISFHSILEGFALGVQDTKAAIVSLFVSLIIHKGVEAFSVGLQVSKGQRKRWHFLLTVGVYAVMTPIGILFGVGLRASDFNNAVKDPIIALLESMACGTFMYVTFLEILAEEKANEEHQAFKLAATFVGFLVISVLQLFFH